MKGVLNSVYLLYHRIINHAEGVIEKEPQLEEANCFACNVNFFFKWDEKTKYGYWLSLNRVLKLPAMLWMATKAALWGTDFC